MNDLRQMGKGKTAAYYLECRPLVDSPPMSRDFSNTRKKEKIPVDNGTYIEQIENIKSKESQMTDMIRDIAAFTSIAMFVASFSLIVMAI